MGSKAKMFGLVFLIGLLVSLICFAMHQFHFESTFSEFALIFFISSCLSFLIIILFHKTRSAKELYQMEENTSFQMTLISLYEREERFRKIAENIREVFWIVDPKTLQFLYLSPAYEKIWGYSREEFFRDPYKMFQVIHSEDRGRIIAAQEDFRSGTFNQEYRIIRPDGTIRWIRDRGFPVEMEGTLYRVVGIAEDITEIRQREELLLKSEKLAVLGELAAGIAHEIRNPLTSLRGFVQLLQKERRNQGEDYIEIMLAEINRINEIVSEFLVLAKPTASHFATHDLRELVKQAVLLMERDCSLHHVEIQTIFETARTLIHCEQNHLKLVFINVLKNAIEAMPSGGNILIRVTPSDDAHILVSIIDEGCGIPQERLHSIGEPFYTTKGKGVGLGLMVSFKIIENHRGKISFSSRVGQGTVVEIRLPLAESEHGERT